MTATQWSSRAASKSWVAAKFICEGWCTVCGKMVVCETVNPPVSPFDKMLNTLAVSASITDNGRGLLIARKKPDSCDGLVIAPFGLPPGPRKGTTGGPEVEREKAGNTSSHNPAAFPLVEPPALISIHLSLIHI